MFSDIPNSGETEETRLREWAREHYVPLPERSLSWPGFVLDEMRRLDTLRIDQAHDAVSIPKLLLRVPKCRAQE